MAREVREAVCWGEVVELPRAVTLAVSPGETVTVARELREAV